MTRALLAAALLAACGPPAAEVRAARESGYQTDRATLWRELVAEMHAQFPATGIAFEDERRGLIESRWKSVEATQEATETAAGARVAIPARIVFRMQVRILPGGPPWLVAVDGEAVRYRPELSALETLQRDSEDEPAWVRERIEALRVAIHRRLKPYAVGPVLRF